MKKLRKVRLLNNNYVIARSGSGRTAAIFNNVILKK